MFTPMLLKQVNKRSIAVAEKIGMTYERDVMLENYEHLDFLFTVCNTKEGVLG